MMRDLSQYDDRYKKAYIRNYNKNKDLGIETLEKERDFINNFGMMDFTLAVMKNVYDDLLKEKTK